MKTTWTKGLVVALAIATFGIQKAQATPFTNGSFESTDLGPSGFQFIITGSTLVTGWDVTRSGVGGTDLYLAGTPQSFLLNASDGDQVFCLNGDANGVVTTISQTFDTIASTSYQVLFDLSRETPGGGGPDAPISVVATGNSALTNLFNSGSSWVTQTYNFTATGALTTLTFSRTSAGQGNSPVLDNVRLNVVPEPSSLALLACGTIGLLRMSRNRRNMQ